MAITLNNKDLVYSESNLSNTVTKEFIELRSKPNDHSVVWEQALSFGLPFFGDLKETVIHEYASYYNVSKEEAEKLIFNVDYNKRALEKWNNSKHSSAQDDVIKFFGESNEFICTNLLASVMKFDIEQRVFMLDFMKKNNCNSMLEFGGALGSTALLYLMSGVKDVWLADIGDDLLSFAKWRANARGKEMKTVNLTSENLPENHFDMITAFQCFEQIENPYQSIDLIKNALKPNGYFSVYVHYLKPDPKKPWNINVFPEFLFKMRTKYNFKKLYWKDYENRIHAIYQKQEDSMLNKKYFFTDSLEKIKYSNKIK